MPNGFRFAVKASRFCTNRRVLADAGESVTKFVQQGLVELGDRLGPILWQFMPTKTFDAEDFGAFLQLLPASVEGVPLRHALEVRHESFDDPAFLALARDAGAAVVRADHPEYPAIHGHDVGFSYLRLMRSREEEATGYSAAEIGQWADVLRERAADGEVFAFFISGAKVRNPAAAMAVIGHMGGA